MAPVPHSSTDASSTPLADYFFISGIESSQVYDERTQQNGIVTSPLAQPPVDETIEEDRALETDSIRPTSQEGLPNGDTTRRRSANRLSEHRQSIGTIIGPDSKQTASNRSSTTIKGVQLGGSGLSDFDFDVALRKFASERDSFLEEIQFTSGVPQPNRPTPTRPRPRPQRVSQTINDDGLGNLRSGVGSIRRRISTMQSSLKRQPSGARQSSIRTSKRMSGYNSVIPAPQPFQPEPNMHPLLRRYEPVLLDRYPPKNMVEELKRRNPFPDYVPMFAFPNDVSVVSSDERPKSQWHGFAMTNGDGSKLYGICLIVWLPLNATAAEGLENQCEEWRRVHMNPEERELASSLGERLALERAKLSQLLTKLSAVAPDSEERENLEDEIGAVEEKIQLMTDLLRPVRHGAASKIEGLTDGETGLWIPRAYGVMGRDAGLTPFWKEWLKAVVVPMTAGAILRVPASSPRVGMWQPLERYVVNLCAEALSPITSITQVEIAVRELRMYARQEAVNEIPGSRNIDIYALFRCLSIPNIVTLFEFVLSESRIILLSSHTAMLHLASLAITNLLYPFQWAGVFIPVLPARLVQTVEAPCPYIVGIERRYEPADYPEDEYVLVDLDNDSIVSNGPPPPSLPRQQRRKLTALLQHSAPHHTQYGVPTGPPAYAVEAFPNDTFASENSGVFTHRAHPSTVQTYVGLNSTSFGAVSGPSSARPLIHNAFLQSSASSRGNDRPSTASTVKTFSNSPPSPKISPVSTVFPPLPSTPISRSDSGYALQANLREKRSCHFETSSRRSSSFGFERVPPMRRPSQPFLGHAPSASTSSLSHEFHAASSYAPSVYAQSTLAASTIMPGMAVQQVRNTATTQWQEGHCMQWRPQEDKALCSICEEKSDDGLYRCTGCTTYAHGRCVGNICIVCPTAFRPDQVRASFARCFASLLYTYRRYLIPATGDRKKAGMVYQFKMDEFVKSLPNEHVQYITTLQQTQAFNEFIHERESKRPDDPTIKLFDEVILAKRNRGKSSFFYKSRVDFLSDTTDHLWRTASANPPNSRFPGDYRAVISRIPAKLDPTLMKEPRVIQGVPRIPVGKARRKPIPSMLGPNGNSSPPQIRTS
ncbi:dDENN domain-containing protein [Cucurbitaria berberidis CBS 394.84]|uniref:DDENN domain-containing protein n=1 Tax=Cucurbitaria berberidis CBS 394.84 TaxID=1168544 RepID=A0A9P4LBT1_9PLEO|nr:dDENN domain-containing protein [Cucurbitaria berberidis CBS 394.84]KAF1849936.1 dDENN domain-containing protein [Cucurbitaria berberidis CBS 394.84]